MKESFLEQLFYTEAAGYSDEKTPEDAEGRFWWEAIFAELEKHIPDNTEAINRFYSLFCGCLHAYESAAFKRAMRFTASFMCEALLPLQKTEADYKADLERALK